MSLEELLARKLERDVGNSLHRVQGIISRDGAAPFSDIKNIKKDILDYVRDLLNNPDHVTEGYVLRQWDYCTLQRFLRTAEAANWNEPRDFQKVMGYYRKNIRPEREIVYSSFQ